MQIALLSDGEVRGYDVMLKVLAHICIPRVSVFNGCFSHYIIHFNFLLLADEIFFLILCMYHFSCESAEPKTFDRVNWLDVKIIFLQACHLVPTLLTHFLLYKKCAYC